MMNPMRSKKCSKKKHPFSVAFVTGHIGPDDTHIPKKPKGYDAYFVTNNQKLSQKAARKNWIPQLIHNVPLIDPSDSSENFLKNSFASKPLKVFPDTFCNKPYDYIIWIDDKYNSRIRSNININNVIK